MGTIDDPAVIGRIIIGLSTELEPEILNDVCKTVSYTPFAIL